MKGKFHIISIFVSFSAITPIKLQGLERVVDVKRIEIGAKTNRAKIDGTC